MKTHIIPTALAGLGLAVLPLQAEDQASSKSGTAEPAAAQAAAVESIPTYTVHIKGGG